MLASYVNWMRSVERWPSRWRFSHKFPLVWPCVMLLGWWGPLWLGIIIIAWVILHGIAQIVYERQERHAGNGECHAGNTQA